MYCIQFLHGARNMVVFFLHFVLMELPHPFSADADPLPTTALNMLYHQETYPSVVSIIFLPIMIIFTSTSYKKEGKKNTSSELKMKISKQEQD